MAKKQIIVNGKTIEVEETKPGLFGELGYQYADSSISTPKTTNLAPQVESVASTILPTNYSVSGASASFLADASEILKNIGKINEKIASAYPAPEETEQKLTKQLELGKAETSEAYQKAREDILKQAEWARQELAPLREQIFSKPALSKRDLDAYSLKIDKLTTEVNNTIERLTKEEQRALENLDLEYADKIKQTKLDYLNFQSELLENSFNLLTQRFNIQQSILTQQKDTSATLLEQILNTYSGKGLSFEKLPASVRVAAENASNVLGIPMEIIKDNIESIKRDLQIVREGDYTSIYDKNTGNLIQRYYVPSAESSQVKINDLSKLTDLDFKSEISKNGYVDVSTYFAHLSNWQSEAPDKIKWFFINYPTSVYLPPITEVKSIGEKELYGKIVDIEKVVIAKEAPDINDLIYQILSLFGRYSLP